METCSARIDPHTVFALAPRVNRLKHALTVKRLIFGITALALGVAAWFAFNANQRAPKTRFTLLSGQKISTAQLTGKVYLVNFWATSCSACRREMPQMIETYETFKNQGVELIAVAMAYDPPAHVRHYAQEMRLPFKVAIDDGSAARQFGDVQLTPTTFVVSRDGRILKRYIGIPDFSALYQIIQSALG
ncbi:Putative thiol-disulfide isomerase and thioredoxins [Candidatus Glomeribacter gigasporarum BEG34]|uniref:Putative thiol-disulfide isomerase and thioredoxins n=1 Tax=Candidatus Glomeribacter gigasporarum BEG34 TaxID=1070319 RepID=G2JAF8_9BURK|nr:Putative thiol-disulfide isomerase and thioredoxins [Candidatus Glomeribacter gigasporarum BEG34]